MGQLHSVDCEQVRGHISVGLDDELSEVEGARVEAHLSSCGACRAFAVDVGGATNILRSAPLEDLGFPIVLPRRRLAVVRRVPVAAAAAALAVAVGVGALTGGSGSGNTDGLQQARTSAAQSASFRFPENELRMLHQASAARANRGRRVAMTL
jgi:predicted anti-sigma-YlaC factor YlaD